MKRHFKHYTSCTLLLWSLFGLLPLLVSLESCSDFDGDGNVSGGKGQTLILFSIGSIEEGSEETIFRANESDNRITGITDLGNGVYMSATFEESQLGTTRVAKENLNPNVRYRIIVYTGTGAYKTHQDYQIGTTMDDMVLDVGVSYTLVAYSYNSSSPLPTITSAETSTTLGALSGVSLMGVPAGTDLLYWTGTTGALNAGSNTVSITFSRKTNQIRVSFDASNMNAVNKNITAVTDITLSSYAANMKLFDGSLTKNGTGSALTLTPGSPLGGTTVTPGNYSDAMYNGGSPFTLNVGSVTIGGTTYKNKFVPFATSLSPGKRYTLNINFKDFTTLPTGTAKLTGKQCFDIGYTDQASDGRGYKTVRSTYVGTTSFANQTVMNAANTSFKNNTSGVQVYTLTPTAPISYVSFIYDDPDGLIDHIDPIGGYPGTNISSATVTVYYKTSLDESLKGLNAKDAKKVTIYAVYNNNAAGTGTMAKAQIKASFMDAACCGAVNEENGWTSFMCYNLGADEIKNPFVFADANTTWGYLYQWGRQSDGHQLRNSSTIGSQAGSIIPGNANFILTSSDWFSGANSNLVRWGDGTQNANPPKGPNDPCPIGWKVPSSAQWIAVKSNNAHGAWSSGFIFGGNLYIPNGGYRSNTSGNLTNTNDDGYYWSSTPGTEPSFGRGSNGSNVYVVRSPSTVVDFYSDYRALGAAIRCVAE